MLLINLLHDENGTVASRMLQCGLVGHTNQIVFPEIQGWDGMGEEGKGQDAMGWDGIEQNRIE